MKTTVMSALAILGGLLLAAAAGHAQTPTAPAGATATAVLHADQPGPVVNKNIYGHFAEHLGRGIYEGIWVGPSSPIPNTRGIRNDVVAALKELNIPVLRWPGGCFADEYHWKDGIGPREKRPSMINTHWGGVVEDNSFGTHEFMDLVEQLGTDAYITGNVGSGTPQEMMEWVEYMTSDAISPMANLRRQNGRDKPWRVPYFGVGNEPWGCGGNMRAGVLRRRVPAATTPSSRTTTATKPIYRIAGGANAAGLQVDRGADGAASAGGWTACRSTTTRCRPATGPRRARRPASARTSGSRRCRSTLRMDELITKHAAIMDKAEAEMKARRQRTGPAPTRRSAWSSTSGAPGTT